MQEVPFGLAVKGFDVDVNAINDQGYTTLMVLAATPGDFYLYAYSVMDDPKIDHTVVAKDGHTVLSLLEEAG